MLRRSKKGDMNTELQVKLIDLLLIGVFILMVLQFISGIEDNTMAHKEYLARDFAFLLNTIYAAPVTVEDFSYSPANVDMSDFDVDLSKGRVSVKDAGETGKVVYYPYAADTFMTFERPDTLSGAGTVHMAKEKDTLTLAREQGSVSHDLCAGIIDEDGPSIRSRHIFLHPGEGLNPGRLWSGAELDDRRIMWEFADELKRSELRKIKSNDGHIHIVDSETKDSEIQRSPDMLVTLYPNVAQAGTEPFTIQYLSGSSTRDARRLACLIKEKISSDPYIDARHVTDIEIGPIYPADLPSDHPYHPVAADRPVTVIIEWGNVDEKGGLYDDPAPVLVDISDAVEAFYSG